MESDAYSEAIKRKEDEVNELKEERKMLLRSLMEKERQISALNDIMKKLKEKIK